MPPSPLAMSPRQAELEIQQLGHHVKRCWWARLTRCIRASRRAGGSTGCSVREGHRSGACNVGVVLESRHPITQRRLPGQARAASMICTECGMDNSIALEQRGWVLHKRKQKVRKKKKKKAWEKSQKVRRSGCVAMADHARALGLGISCPVAAPVRSWSGGGSSSTGDFLPGWAGEVRAATRAGRGRQRVVIGER